MAATNDADAAMPDADDYDEFEQEMIAAGELLIVVLEACFSFLFLFEFESNQLTMMLLQLSLNRESCSDCRWKATGGCRTGRPSGWSCY